MFLVVRCFLLSFLFTTGFATTRPGTALTRAESAPIAILLPLTGISSTVGKQFSEATLRAARALGQPTSMVSILDTQSDGKRVASLMQELKKERSAKIVIGGATAAEASVLRFWAPKLEFPSILLLANERQNQGPHTNDFYVSVAPRLSDLQDLLLETCRSKGVSRLVTLGPARLTSRPDIVSLKDQAAKQNVSITQQAWYDPHDSESVDQALRQILKIEDETRSKEIAMLRAQREDEAALNDQQFNPTLVALTPKVEFDALYVMDDFRMTRYLVKMVQSYGASIPLYVGGPQWRSKDLVSSLGATGIAARPRGFFVDFVGLYSNLSAALLVSDRDVSHGTSSRDTTVAADEAEGVDFALMMHRGLEIALESYRRNSHSAQGLMRSMLTLDRTAIASITGNRSGPVFDADGQLIAPLYVFGVGRNDIFLERAR